MTASRTVRPALRAALARHAHRPTSHPAKLPAASIQGPRGQAGDRIALPTYDGSLYELARAGNAEAEAHMRGLETIVATMSDGVLVTDRRGERIRANQAFRRLLGLDHNGDDGETSLVECNAQIDLRDAQGQPVPPERVPTARILRGEVLNGPTALDLTLRAPDGRCVDVSITGAPLWTTVGGIIGTVAVYRDVTEQRHLERRAEEALHVLLGMAEALVTLDGPAETALTPEVNEVVRSFAELASNLLSCQRMSLTLLDPETERLQPMFGLGWSVDVEHQWKAQGNRFRLRDFIPAPRIERLRAGEVVVVDGTSMAPVSGQPEEVSQTLVAPLLRGPLLIGVLALDYGDDPHQFTRQEHVIARAAAQVCTMWLERGRQVREQRWAQEREVAAREAVRRMELFMAMASHECRTPLTVIKGYQQLTEQYLDMLLPDAAKGESLARTLQTARESLAQAQQASVRLSTLLDDLLQVASARAGKLRMHPQPCDVMDIVSETVRQLRRTNPTRRLSLMIPANRRAPIIADPERIVQVVTNYLANAFKYAPADQAVEVRVQIRECIVRVSVRDQGPGLRVADKKAIWEGFCQASGVQLQPGSDVGLGVGLYVCRTIVEQHEGQVGVDSSVGRGSTFWFTLPLSSDAI
jgi:signal transduction histidine kinase/PAS domain-containing protein